MQNTSKRCARCYISYFRYYEDFVLLKTSGASVINPGPFVPSYVLNAPDVFSVADYP